MTILVFWLFVFLTILLAVPAAMLCLEILAAISRRASVTQSSPIRRGRVAVVVPAHNEGAAMIPTLDDIKGQLRPDDRLLVVADNCDDDTAAVGTRSGAEVVERRDSERRGKGYALDWGIRSLDNDPPDVVVMIDADCRLAADAIGFLTDACSVTGRPAQALYLMTLPAGSAVSKQIGAFAWRLKNWVRPQGLKNLGQPCQLMGTGMAFPWRVIRSVELASGWIVEDLKLGLDLATAKAPPLFCPSALVTSQFAGSVGGVASQRSRWEHGHIATIITFAPRLLLMAIAQRNFSLLVLTLDLIIPPLSLLVLSLVSACCISGLMALLGLGSAPLIISSSSLASVTAIVGFAWNKYGRDVLPARAIVSMPIYVLSKFGLYGQILLGKMTTQWVRTDRNRD